MLREFIGLNRDELIGRCRAKVASESGPPLPDDESEKGVPLFLDQLVNELEGGPPNARAMNDGATRHGRNLFFRGLSLSQVVHDYGNVCQSITDLAIELHAPIDSDDFRTLNRCLDQAIAGAVSEYARQKQLVTDDRAHGQSVELKNLIFTALAGFEILQSGTVGVTGTTGALVHRSLLAIQELA